MAIGASILRGEVRRHLLMNCGLVASCVVGATVVTNERGLFVPITLDMSDTARAYAAMFTQSHLLPDHEITNVQMVTPLAPFEVTADSRDLRRRLMDAMSGENDPTTAGTVPGQPSDFSQNSSQMPALDNQVLTLNSSGTSQTTSGTTGGTGGGAAGGGSGSGGNGTTVASNTGNTGSTTGTGNTNNTQPITLANNNNNNAAQSQSASGVTDGSALGNTAANDTGTGLGNSGTDQTTGPAAVPEPSIWAMLIAGFGMIGYVLRSSGRKRRDGAEADATV